MKRELWSAGEYDAEAQRLYDRGEFGRALAVLREGLSLHPSALDLHVSLGYTEIAREQFAWARMAFEEALLLDPDHEEALVGLGDILLKMGERGRAFLIFERITEMGLAGDPDLALAMARSLYRENLYEHALARYRDAGDSADALAEMGYTLFQLGRREEALRQTTRALAADPDHHEARAFHANLLYEAGRYDEALDQFGRVPPEAMWDPLAVWRTVEMMRSFDSAGRDDPRMLAYLDRLEALTAEPSPEDRVLAEVAARRAGPGGDGRTGHRDQLDLFVSGAEEPIARDPEVHAVRSRDGRIYTGDWLAIVGAIRDRSEDPTVSIAEFMRKTARMVRGLTGIAVPDDDPEAFLRASARAGILRIER